MVKDALFDGYYDIPFIPKQHFDLVIDKLIAYDKTYKHIYEPGEVVHFYLDDQKFDGPKGIWNVYRSRVVGYYLTTLGYNVIPNVRWTDEESYDFAFDGLYEGQIVAVGTLGCSKTIADKILLINGFIEMIKRIKPRLVIIYGPICRELQYVINKYNIKIEHFDSDISSFYGGKADGNEE